MKMLIILILFVLSGCGDKEEKKNEVGLNGEEMNRAFDDAFKKLLAVKPTLEEIKTSNTITDEQAEIVSGESDLKLNNLTSITDAQAKSLSNVKGLELNGVISLTDQQAEYLSDFH